MYFLSQMCVNEEKSGYLDTLSLIFFMILRDLDFIIHPLILRPKLKVAVLEKSGRQIADSVFTNIFVEAKIIRLVWEDHWARATTLETYTETHI